VSTERPLPADASRIGESPRKVARDNRFRPWLSNSSQSKLAQPTRSQPSRWTLATERVLSRSTGSGRYAPLATQEPSAFTQPTTDVDKPSRATTIFTRYKAYKAACLTLFTPHKSKPASKEPLLGEARPDKKGCLKPSTGRGQQPYTKKTVQFNDKVVKVRVARWIDPSVHVFHS
jgi:hypothetical protein